MKSIFLKSIFIYFIYCVSVLPSEPVKVVKKFVGYLRYKKNDKAVSLLDVKIFSKNLLPKSYHQLNKKQKEDLEQAVSSYIKKKVFSKANKYFYKVNLIYGSPKKKDKKVSLSTSILYKTKEKVTFSWILQKKGNRYLITDFILEDGKLASRINQKRAEKLFAKKGPDYLIQSISKIANR